MKKTFIVALLAATATSLRASPLLYESFDYPAGDGANLSTADGTAAGTAPWIHSGGVAEPLVKSVGGLTYPGLLTSGDGFSLQYDGAAASGTPAYGLGSSYTSGTLYYSLLLKVTDVGAVNGFTTGGNLTGGSFMAGLETLAPATTPTVGGSAAPLLIRSGDGTQFSTTYQLGTAITATAVDRQWVTTQTFSTGPSAETVFVVLKYDFAGSGSASLFLNPTPGGAEPAAQLTVTTGAALVGGIQSFFFRNNSVEPETMLVDELRIGTTWADVTPVPEPATIALGSLGALVMLLRYRSRRC